MNIPSHELQAFRMVATVCHFSKAAKRIHISQPALSQRIKNLERKLGVTLFIRDKKIVKLTTAGMRLLRFCQTKDNLELELLNDLVETTDGKLSGHLRIAGFSSIMNSVLIPTIAPLLRDHQAIQFEFITQEMDQLPGLLMRGEADFVIMDYQYHHDSIKTQWLGQERYVLIQSKKYPLSNVYLDHHPNDQTTKLFLKSQGINYQHISRSYMNDINGVINGVTLGLGQGVVPMHLLQKKLHIKIIKNIKSMNTPIILHYFHQPYYSRLQKMVIEKLKECQQYL